jgi:hypothetical protein
VGTGRDHRPADRLPLSLVVDEEERPIAHDRPAEHAAELIAAELRLLGVRRGEDVARVQRLVTEELERRAMEGVGARLGRQVDDAAIEAAELGWRTVRFDRELLDRVDRREERDLTGLGLQHRDAVEQILVRARPSAVDARELRGRRQRHPGREGGKRDEAAPVQRQGRHFCLRHHLPEAGGRALQRRIGRDGDALADAADGQLEIEADGFARLDADALAAHGPEPAEGDVDTIGARRQAREREDAGRGRYRLT